MADAFGHASVAADLRRCGGNWRNVWDTQLREAEFGFSGFPHPRLEDGEWFAPPTGAYRKDAGGGWSEVPLASPMEASAWQRGDDGWRIQFPIGEAQKVLTHMAALSAAQQVSMVTALTEAKKVVAPNLPATLHRREIHTGLFWLVRVDGSARLSAADLPAALTSDQDYKAANSGARALFVSAHV